jgi:hypothetical protein
MKFCHIKTGTTRCSVTKEQAKALDPCVVGFTAIRNNPIQDKGTSPLMFARSCTSSVVEGTPDFEEYSKLFC